jgi:hypothetical protein
VEAAQPDKEIKAEMVETLEAEQVAVVLVLPELIPTAMVSQ